MHHILSTCKNISGHMECTRNLSLKRTDSNDDRTRKLDGDVLQMVRGSRQHRTEEWFYKSYCRRAGSEFAGPNCA